MTKYAALALLALGFALSGAPADALTLSPLGVAAGHGGITRIDDRCGRFRHYSFRLRRCLLN